MSKWRLFIEETHHMIYEVEATDPLEAATKALTGGVVLSKVGVIEAKVIKTENMDNDTKAEKTAQKFDPLDTSHKMN